MSLTAGAGRHADHRCSSAKTYSRTAPLAPLPICGCTPPDTSTVVSAFLWGGPPARLLGATREQCLELATSAALLDELLDVPPRRKFARKLEVAGLSVAQLEKTIDDETLVLYSTPTLLDELKILPTRTDSPSRGPD